jgi:hypothetical protein
MPSLVSVSGRCGTGTIGITVRHRGFVSSLGQTYVFTNMFQTEKPGVQHVEPVQFSLSCAQGI